MSITTDMIRQLREATGAGVLDCKKALEATDGDVEQAIAYLREKGLAAAAKKADRVANEGLVVAEVNEAGTLGALVELNCETDFVARTEDFQALAGALLRQVLEQPALATLEALLAAPFIDDSGQTVQERITDTVAKLGENISARHVARFDAANGNLIEGYVHPGSRIGVLVEVEPGAGVSDQGALQELAHDLSLQIAAARPSFLAPEDVPAEELAAKTEFYQAELAAENKPADIKARIVEGKLSKWYKEVCLLKQPFVKDDSLTVEQLLQQKSKELGGRVSIRRFARFELGSS